MAALVLGILGLLSGLVAVVGVVAVPALILSALAIVLGVEGRRAAAAADGGTRRGMADVGIVLGALGVAASIVNIAFGWLQGPLYLVVLTVLLVGLPVWGVVRLRRRKVRTAEQALVEARPPDGWPLVFHDNVWQRLFRVTTGAETYGPGDTVTGTVAVAEPSPLVDPTKLLTRARSVSVGLRYVDHSAAYHSPNVGHVAGSPFGVEGERAGRAADYRAGTDHVTATVHEGEIDPTSEYPFSLRLPDRPRPAGAWGVVHLYWAVSVHVDRRVGADVDEVHPIEVVGPAGATPPAMSAPVKVGPLRGWDVAVTSPAEVGRGDELEVVVEVGDPSPARTDLQLGLECRAHYAAEGRKLVSRGEFEGLDMAYKRKSADDVVHEQWVEVQGSSPQQLVALRVPADGPFSHPGECAALAWELVIREPKRRHGFHQLRLPVTVLP